MSQLTLADCWPRRFPLFAGAAVLRSHPGGTAAVYQASAGEAPSPSSGRRRRIGGAGEPRQFTDLPAVSAHFAARGWPVWLRRSGGGLVPQGAGHYQPSLIWPVQQPADSSPNRSISLCAVLQRTLALRLPATPGR